MEWFGELPERWEQRKIKYLFSERVQKGYPDEPLLVASQNMGVVPKGIYGNRTVEATKDLHLLKLVEVGDFVISLRSFQGGIEYAYYRGIISPAYTVMVPHTEMSAGYFRFFAKSARFIEMLQNMVTGIREGQNINYAKLREELVPLPPREEQDKIVRYLDWKVSQINKLINAKKTQIALLQEQKQAVINRAVTRGLDPDVEMKDSGIKWLGDIPSQWEICRCKYLFSERNERSEKGTETHLSMSQKYGLVSDEQLDERRMLSESYAGAKLCYADDLVLNRLKAHLGVFAVAPHLGVISPDYTVLQPNVQKIIPTFALYVLKSGPCRRELRIRVQGVVEGFWRLYTNAFNTIVLPLPSLDEQQAILDWIRLTAEKMDLSISTIQKEITLLHEYRTRLISDVVTGKLDVRGVAVPDYEAVEEVADAADIEIDETEGEDDAD